VVGLGAGEFTGGYEQLRDRTNAGRDGKNDTSTRGNRTTATGAGVGRVRSISSISKRASWFLAGRSMESLGIGWSSAGLSDGAAGKRGQAGQAGRTRDTTLGDPRTVIGRAGDINSSGHSRSWGRCCICQRLSFHPSSALRRWYGQARGVAGTVSSSLASECLGPFSVLTTRV
jgi:hypothetical protein